MASQQIALPRIDFFTQVSAVVGAELQKLRHDPMELATRAIQPALWLLLFGEVMAQVRGLAPGHIRYLDFLSAGILAQSVLFVAIFYGIAVIWERDLGILHRYLVSPAPRSALVLGKAISASVRGLSQAVIVYLLAFGLGVAIDLAPLPILGVVVFLVLGGVGSLWGAVLAGLMVGLAVGHTHSVHKFQLHTPQAQLADTLDAVYHCPGPGAAIRSSARSEKKLCCHSTCSLLFYTTAVKHYVQCTLFVGRANSAWL